MKGRWILVALAVVILASPGTSGATSMGSTGKTVGRTGAAVGCGSVELTGVPSGTARSTSAALGSISATLSGSVATIYGIPALADATIKVLVDHKQVMTGPVAIQQASSGSPLIPEGLGPEEAPGPWSWVVSTPVRPLCVARFGGADPETAVLVGMYSGGAHCCTSIDAYVVRSNAVSTVPVERDFGNPGASLISSDGHAVIVTADNAFAYQFASYGGSGMPLMVIELRSGKFVVTTREHPGWVGVDAGFQWGSYIQSQNGLGLGWLAAWAADECTLDQAAQAWNTLDQLQAQGSLDSGPPGWPTGSAYVIQLRSFLSAHGYCS
jgi:hypothetical protein